MPKKKNSNNKEIMLLLLIALAAFFLWDTIVIYPIKLFVILFHEASHVFAAIISGGTIQSVTLDFNLGGETSTSNGNEILIALAGYTGSLIVGLVLFISGVKKKLSKFLISGLIIFVIIVLANSNPSSEFIIISSLSILVLLLLAIFGENNIVAFISKTFGLISMIYVLLDIKSDLFISGYKSDAVILSQLTEINQYLISVIWLGLSGVIVFFTIKLVYFDKKIY